MRTRKRVKSQQSWRRRRRSSSIPNHPRFHCQPQNLHCLPFPTSPPTAATSLLSLVTMTTPASVLGASPKLSCLQSLLGWPASFKVPAQIRFPNNKSFPLIFIQFIKKTFLPKVPDLVQVSPLLASQTATSQNTSQNASHQILLRWRQRNWMCIFS